MWVKNISVKACARVRVKNVSVRKTSSRSDVVSKYLCVKLFAGKRISASKSWHVKALCKSIADNNDNKYLCQKAPLCEGTCV